MYLSNLFISKKKDSIGFHWYKGESLLWNLVQFIINYNLIDHRGKFKEGDVVRYNWMARVHLNLLFKKGLLYKGNLLVINILYADKSGIQYKTLEGKEGSCDAFWLRKAYWWEI